MSEQSSRGGWQSQPPPERALARLAARQHGVVAVRQLVALGITANAAYKRAQVGRLHRVHRGVYAVGHARLTLKGRWMAAVLAAGEGAVLSHRAALTLHDLRPVPSGPIDVTVAAAGRRARAGIRLHCVRALDTRDLAVQDAIPVTTVPRTLLDYADTARPQALRLAVEAALRRDLLDGRELDALLARSPGRRGAGALTRLVGRTNGSAPWTQSELERRALALVRAHGLPEPQTNVLLHGELVDLYWPHARVAVEIDSWLYHKTRAQFEADRRRDAKLTLAGIAVLRLTDSRMDAEPAQVGAELLALVQQRAA